jgi:hypothetical protein
MELNPKYILTLENFSPEDHSTNENDLVDFFSGLVDIGGDALQRQLKQKVTAFLLDKLGIKEKSKFSRIVQEVVEEIEIADYYDIVAGRKDANYWAPKLAKSFQGFLLSEGLNGMAESWGLDTTGFLYGTIKEAMEEYFTDPGFQKKFAESVVSLISPLIGGESTAAKPFSSTDSGIRSEIEEFVKTKKPNEKPSKKEAESLVNSMMTGFNFNK